jgi:hypothetical protein
MTDKTSSALRSWMKAATTAEQTALAAAVGTSRMYLYALSNPDAAYYRQPSVGLSIAIEEGTEHLAKMSNGRLPVVLRTDLNEHCRWCRFARACIGPKMLFDIEGGKA